MSVVLLGGMNPKIFSPDWFARQGLMPAEEMEAANLTIVHPRVTQFTAGWLSLYVDHERFQAMTTEPPYIRLCDFVSRTFREFLPHTPLTMIGINRDYHFNLGTLVVRENIGRQLAPPTAWGAWGEKIASGEGEKHGGMRTLIMEHRNLDDRAHGHIQVRVEPSIAIRPAGIYIGVNDHLDASGLEDDKNDAVLSFLERSFDASLARADELADQVLRLKDA